MRILIVKLSSFGDVIHTFPALSDLRAALPSVEVDWLVEEAYAGLAARHPAVSQVHSAAFRRLRWPPSRWPSLLAHRSRLKRQLRARKYDLVLDLQGLVKSALAARLAGAAITGFDSSSAREPAAARFYARRIRLAGDLHIVEQLRRFVAEAVGYPMPSASGHAGLARPAARPDIPLPDEYGLILHAAGWPTKLWPEENWRDLIGGIVANDDAVVLPWGNDEERERAERLVIGNRGASVLPRRLAAEELVALAGHARFAVGLDTGLMHLAAAFDVPGVSLFGPSDAKSTAPYGRNQRVVSSVHDAAPCQQVRCSREPDGQCCMRYVGFASVAREVAGMLGALGIRR